MPDLNLPAWPVFAGIDWGGENHQLCVVAPDGKRLLETRVSHAVAGLHQLDLHLNGFGRQVPVALRQVPQQPVGLVGLVDVRAGGVKKTRGRRAA